MNGTGAGTGGAVNGTTGAGAGTQGAGSAGTGNLGPIGSATTNGNVNAGAAAAAQQQDKSALVEGLNNFGLGSVAPYPASQYQHLLVAN